MLVNPIYLSNKSGVPRIAVSAVAVTDTAVKLTVPSNTLFGRLYNGLILLKLSTAIPSGGAALPVYLTSTEGGDQAITLLGGSTITGAAMETGIHALYYESNTGILQLLV